MEEKEAKITPFQPQNLDAPENGVAIRPFHPKSFGKPVKDDVKNAVKAAASSAGASAPQSFGRFDLHPAAKRLLGVEREETDRIESLVSAQVESKISELQDQAYQEGFEKGRSEGAAQAEVEFLASVKPLYDQFEALCREYDTIKQELYAANEQFLVQLMFQVGKQVLLKELSTDPEYVKRLSSLMIEKIGAKDHVKLKISRQDSANLEQIRDDLKVQFPDLKNIQIEVSDDLSLGGCKVETDLSRINASVETQLQSIEQTLSEA